MRILLCTFVTVVFAFLLAPLVFVIVASFNASSFLSFPPTDWTLSWYGRIPLEFLLALRTSIFVALAVALICTLLGVPAALGIERGRFPGQRAVGTVTMSPLMVPTLVVGVMLFNFYLLFWDWTGISLGGKMIGLILGHTVFTLPYMVRAVQASAAQIDPAMEEAAQSLGATPVQSFFRITMPQIGPGIIAGNIFVFVTSFDDVPVALFLTGGGFTTLPIKIFTTIEFSLTPDVMAVAAIVIYAVVALVILLSLTTGLERFVGLRRD